jgi:DNA-binding NtrC family response regulator
MREKRILVVDDEPLIREFLLESLKQRKYLIEIAATGGEALSRLAQRDFDLVIIDAKLPDIHGIEVLRRARLRETGTGVIMITAFGTVKDAVSAMREGAFDYITKPFGIDELELVIDKFFDYQRLVSENKNLRTQIDERDAFANLVGASPKMRNILETVKTAASTRSTVLIQGPSGTGKGLIASAIHQLSDRRHGPFINTNCAAIPETLIESELFGHEKGAFTGAIKSVKGRFEAADGGTLLLDEISEITPKLQAKLLQVLQEREFTRIGDHHPIRVDVRVIATTNRDLVAEMQSGNFREDLYYRLNVLPIVLPPLSERTEDIPVLAGFFLKKFASENHKPITSADPQVFEVLAAHNWPGNVRELQNAIERAVIMCQEHTLRPSHLSFLELQPHGLEPKVIDETVKLREVEKQMIFRALELHNNNRTKSADALGISVRTLRNKLREYRTNKEVPERYQYLMRTAQNDTDEEPDLEIKVQ